MDTTTSSVALDEQSYTSCIVIDGVPILPPIMNDAKLAEMREWRRKAMERERTRIQQKTIIGIGDRPRPNTATSATTTSSSCDFSLEGLGCFSSTPRPLTAGNKSNKNSERRRPYFPEGYDIPLNLPVSSSTSTSSLDRDIGDKEESDSDSGGNFALSTASSTGTFIIRRSTANPDNPDIDASDANEQSDGEIEDLEEDKDKEEPKTVIRRPMDTMFKRKRPARYFDTNSDDEDKDKLQEKIKHQHQSYSSEDEPSRSFKTEGTSSTSLSKYLSKTPTPLSFTPVPTLMPNAIDPEPSDCASTTFTKSRSPSFTINTKFAEAALSKSKSQSPQRSVKVGMRRSSNSNSNAQHSLSFSSPDENLDDSKNSKNSSGNLKPTDPDFNFVLTNEVPESAVKTSFRKDSSGNIQSDGSDKENQEKERRKHVRRLTYPIANPGPEDEFLGASGTGASAMPVIMINSPRSSVDTASAQSTPVKEAQKGKNVSSSTVNSDDLNAKMDKVQVTLAKLQHLHLGKGKKAHLERYLGELQLTDRSPEGSTSNNPLPQENNKNGVNDVLSRVQDEHQKQLDSLMESFKSQAQKIREEFEKEKSRILSESSNSSSSTLTQNNNQKNKMDQAPSPNSVLVDNSNLRNYYTVDVDVDKTGSFANSEEYDTFLSKSGRSNFTSDSYSRNFHEFQQEHHTIVERSPGEASQLSQATTRTGSVSGREQLGNVGLSNFQTKMKKVNPNLFKHSGDARSPLLKGLVFPDPLARPLVLPKIPSKAYDPAMKPKFDRLTAAAKGYLTRRVLHSEKIQIIIQTIKDTVELLLNLYEENAPNSKGLVEIKDEDHGLHQRLVQQLTGACSSFHDIFFKISVKERMAIIANDREKIRAKAMKNVLSRRMPASPSKRNISNATLRSIERRLTQSRSPKHKDNQLGRGRRSMMVKTTGAGEMSHLSTAGSQSVKPKAVKSYNLSPKRRRLSYWGGGPDKVTKTQKTSISDNVNRSVTVTQRRPYTTTLGNSRNTISSRTTSILSSRGLGSASDTFVVPTNSSWGQSQSTWDSYSHSNLSGLSQKSNNNNNSTSSTISSTSISNRFTTGNKNSRASIANSNITSKPNSNRVPWKK